MLRFTLFVERNMPRLPGSLLAQVQPPDNSHRLGGGAPKPPGRAAGNDHTEKRGLKRQASGSHFAEAQRPGWGWGGGGLLTSVMFANIRHSKDTGYVQDDWFITQQVFKRKTLWLNYIGRIYMENHFCKTHLCLKMREMRYYYICILSNHSH